VSGVGVALAGAHDSRVIGNVVVGNLPSGPSSISGGVVVISDFVGTAPRDNLVTRNMVLRNQPDLFWDGTGSGNVFRRNMCRTSTPAGLCGQ